MVGQRALPLDRSENACDGQSDSHHYEGLMKRIITLLAIAAGAIFGSVGAASAQGIYLDLGPDRGPRPYYRDYDDGPRYRDRERYRGERYGDRRDRGYYRPGGYKTFNGCQNGWTVQDGLCKPYRGY
jgi:hypothetical protein